MPKPQFDRNDALRVRGAAQMCLDLSHHQANPHALRNLERIARVIEEYLDQDAPDPSNPPERE